MWMYVPDWIRFQQQPGFHMEEPIYQDEDDDAVRMAQGKLVAPSPGCYLPPDTGHWTRD